MAVSVRTENKGTDVVTAEREEISGMSWNSQQSVLQTADFREKANIVLFSNFSSCFDDLRKISMFPPAR